MSSLQAARAAKDDLRLKLNGQPWFRGVGLTQLKCMGPDPYELQVNVDTREHAAALIACEQTPRIWLGVPLSFAVVGDIAAYSADGLGAAVSSQDLANVVLGAVTMTATFLLGKIIVNSIIESRKEHFDAKGQPPAAVKAKETTMDGIVKVLSMGYSMYMLSQELPIVLKEAEKLFEVKGK